MGDTPQHATVRPGQSTDGLTVLRLQIWTAGVGTHIAASGFFEKDNLRSNQPLGSFSVRYPMLELPAVGQVMYGLGDELKRNWARFGKTE